MTFAEQRSSRADDLVAELALDGSDTPTDGRRTRRVRNKIAVIDAYLDLVSEGNESPSVAEVAERSRVSHRSVFRYFADKDDLARSSIDRQLERVRPLLSLEMGPEGPLEDRVEHIVTRRFALFDELAPVARLMRVMAAKDELMHTELRRNRRLSREQIRGLFARELDEMPRDRAEETLGVVDVLCSFEAAELMLHDQELEPDRCVATLRRTITQLLH